MNKNLNLMKTSADEIECEFVFVPEFLARLGFRSRVTLDNLEKQTEDFPRRVQLGRSPGARIGWRRNEVDRYFESRPRGFGPNRMAVVE